MAYLTYFHHFSTNHYGIFGIFLDILVKFHFPHHGYVFLLSHDTSPQMYPNKRIHLSCKVLCVRCKIADIPGILTHQSTHHYEASSQIFASPPQSTSRK